MVALWTIIIVLLPGLVTLGHAGTMRCETGRIVSTRDSIDDVLDKCGEPTTRRKDKRCHDLGAFQGQHPHKKKSSKSSDCIAVEVWTYDFGARRLTQKLTFSNGILGLIETGGYGKE